MHFWDGNAPRGLVDDHWEFLDIFFVLGSQSRLVHFQVLFMNTQLISFFFTSQAAVSG